MYNKEMKTLKESARIKTDYLNNNKRYILIPILGGVFVVLGTTLSTIVGATIYDAGSPYYKIAMGLTFGIALNLVALAGGDLFTSNSMIVAIGVNEKVISWIDAIKLLALSWVGNLIGSLIGAFLLVQSGVISGEMSFIGDFAIKLAKAKMSIPFMQLFIRAILCNFLVCLSIWIAYKFKEETAKIIMITWCVFIFVTAGFEHSVANMGLLSIGLMVPGSEVLSIGGFFYNILIATLGNFVGGAIILGLTYNVISKGKDELSDGIR